MRRNKKLTLGVLKRVSSLQALPVLLYAMMTNPALASLCGFAPNGQSFYVTSSKEFHETVLPQVRS
jgi:hypothetical protein